MAITASDYRARFTKALIDVYQERIRPTSFLRQFFPAVTEPTRLISIEVERMGEKVAVDVVRGTEGNRNRFSKSTEKIFEPPIYREYFDVTEEDLYDRVLGSQGNANAPLFAALLNRVSDRLGLLQDKIERAIELQCSQVLIDGIITTKYQDNIDFKRRAESIVDLTSSGGYWATNNDLFVQLEAGCDFMRQYGKSGDGIFNVILGATAFQHMLNNTKFQARQDLVSMSLDSVIQPVRGATGAVFHGTLSVGSYKLQIWTYPQFYEDPNNSNTLTPYIDNKKGVIIPVMPRFKTAFAAVPQLVGEPGQLPTQGQYVIGEFIDTRKATHEFDIQSAPLAIPIAVDQMYTFKAVS
jgi:hypothetical protein